MIIVSNELILLRVWYPQPVLPFAFLSEGNFFAIFVTM